MKKDLSVEVFINSVPGETRLAVTQKGRLAELIIVSDGKSCLLGDIYLGIVEKVLVGLNAAFVNIGQNESGYLTANDGQIFDRGRDKPKPIKALFKEGDAIVVQIIREASEGKGPKLTTRLNLVGRGVVATLGRPGISLSKNIIDEVERKRLKNTLAEYYHSTCGMVIRTKARLIPSNLLEKEVKSLVEKISDIESASLTDKAPACLYKEVGRIKKYLADYGSRDWRRIVVDDRVLLMQLLKYSKDFIPELEALFEPALDRVALYETHDLEQQIEDLFEARVALASGGRLIIEETSALTAIDVDSGAYTRRVDPEEFAVGVNQEAAIEVARQLVLRNIAGQIIIDFLPMKRKENKEIIKALFREELVKAGKCNIFGFSKLGLLEMTRQRVGESIANRFLLNNGPVKSIKTIAVDVVRVVLRELDRNFGKKITVSCSPKLYFYLKTDTHAIWRGLLQRTGPVVVLAEETALPENKFEIRGC